MVEHLGDDVAEAVTPELLRCRRVVATRPGRIPSASIDGTQRSLIDRGREIREIDATVAATNGFVALVNLDEVIVSQSVVSVDDLRVTFLESPPQLSELIELCVPLNPGRPPVVGYDNRNRTWIVRGNDANIDVVGRYAGPVGEGTEGTQLFGFIVQARPSRVTVHRSEGVLVLVDGHHRALSLWLAGIREVPAVIIDEPITDDIGLGQLPRSVVLDSRAPQLNDYFNDDVSIECRVANSDTMIVIGAQRLQTPI